MNHDVKQAQKIVVLQTKLAIAMKLLIEYLPVIEENEPGLVQPEIRAVIKEYPKVENFFGSKLATATPDLLQACRNAEADLYGMVTDYMDIDVETSDEPQAKTVRELRQAIAKATD